MRTLHRRFSTAGPVLTLWLLSACGRAVPDWTVLPIAPSNAELSASAARFVILDGPHRWAIADFELHGDTLDLLDRSDHTISAYRKQPDGSWRFATLIADARQDSAMLRVAAAMSRSGASLVVVGKDASVWQLGLGGKIIASARPDFGCVPQRPRVVALAGNTLLIAGACFDADNVMREVLWRGTMDGGFVRIASEIRYSTDGNRGYLLASTHALTPTASGALFGIGVANCLWAVDARPTAPREVCPLVKFAHRVGDPGEAAAHTLSAFRARYRVGGRAFEWQPLLPVYVDHIRIAGTLVLARRAGGDTVVLVRATAERNEPPLISGPAGTFVGCKIEGCLWFDPSTTVDRVGIVSSDSLAALLRARPGAP